ncbi:MAG: hypothetical protein Q8933_20065 [Bacteroidota bacterium]|nr:hypothetical protein [Bacteroidota bacterium]
MSKTIIKVSCGKNKKLSRLRREKQKLRKKINEISAHLLEDDFDVDFVRRKDTMIILKELELAMDIIEQKINYRKGGKSWNIYLAML